MPSIAKFAAFLFLVAGIAGLGVGYVNNLTAPLIEEQILQRKLASFQEVYPAGERVEDQSATYLQGPHDPALKEVNIAYRGAAPAGVIYALETKGYSGPISFLAGFDLASGRITAIKVLSQRETPGLGAKAKEPFFQERFRDKGLDAPLEVTKTTPVRENQIQAITASTITTRAVTVGVNAAREHFLATFVRK